MCRLRKPIVLMVLAVVAMGVPGCDLLRQAEGPELEVTSPQNFATVQVGDSVDVVSTATDPKGVTRVELWVGRNLYDTEHSRTPDGEIAWTVVQIWTPTEPGFYTLTVVAYNADEVASTPWAVAIEVEEGPTTGGTPAPTVPAGTPPPPTATPQPRATTAPSPPPSTATVPPPPPATATSPPPPTNTPIPASPTPPPMADLYVAEFSMDPEQPSAGHWAEFRVVVRNRGDASSGSYVLRITWPAFGAGEIGWHADPLAADEQAVYTAQHRFADPGPGTVVASIDIDPGDQDGNEDNNTMELPVNVRAALPDMYIDYLVVRPLSPIQGEAALVAVLVRNGGGESGPFRVRWLSGEPEESGCVMDFPSIAGGGAREEACEYTYRGRGYFITWAIVDEDGEVEESDETNNRLDLRIQVLHP